MLSFEPSLKLEKALKRLQEQVVSTASGLGSLSAEEAHYLNRCALIRNVGASTRIENALLTDIEVEWVDTTLSADGRTTAFEQHKEFILDKLSKDRERSVEEVVGCREVLSTIYSQTKDFIPLTEMVIRGLHHDLLKFYLQALPYAGAYKSAPNRVISQNHATGEVRTVLDPAPPGIITETAMAELVAWYNASRHESPWPLLAATEFVFRFLAIHPFQDGNGRIGRALFLLALLQSDDAHLARLMPYVALDRRIEQNRAQYYSVLHEVSEGVFQADPSRYHYEPLAWFFLKMLEGALQDVAHYRERYTLLQKLSGTAASVLQSFKSHPEQRLRVNDIVSATQLPRRTVQYALKTLSDQGFLQRLGQGAGVRYQLVF
ncbi:MAG: Fic family protein [Burkholderiales bacterium]|nr:Fic family protein [Burkholderiales bacterium]